MDIRPGNKTLKPQQKQVKSVNRNSGRLKRKKRSVSLVRILTVVFLSVFCVVIIILVSFSVADTQLPADFNPNSLLSTLNEKSILIKEKNVVMESETEGTATIVVTLPDYQLLFENAIKTDHPDNYVLKAFISNDYETQEFETSAPVTVENGERIIHTNEAVHQLLEKNLVNAINALSKERS